MIEGTKFVLLTKLTLRKERGGTVPYISASSLKPADMYFGTLELTTVNYYILGTVRGTPSPNKQLLSRPGSAGGTPGTLLRYKFAFL